MARMFQGKADGDGAVETYIGPSVKVEGDFVGEGNLVIEGVVVGNVTTKNNLRVGPEAVIEAEVKAKDAQIAGRIAGNVTIKGRLDLSSSAQILGNVKCSVLSVETGGVINGKLEMMTEPIKHVPLASEEIKREEKEEADKKESKK